MIIAHVHIRILPAFPSSPFVREPICPSDMEKKISRNDETDGDHAQYYMYSNRTIAMWLVFYA